jgi:rhodanese-related sulfurtransferase
MSETPISYVTESPMEIEQRVRSGAAILLDVREQDEWDAGHLKHAKWLPLSQIQELKSASDAGISQGTPIYCHCKAGVRSVYATAFLRQLGFDCFPLQQGFEELASEGLERLGP